MMNWFLDAMLKYAVFKGRSQRKAYWMFVLFAMLISVFSALFFSVFEAILGFEGLALMTNVIFSLSIIIPSWSLGVRRMHDIGVSGWWLLFPAVGYFMVMFMAGESGDNKYGPDPKAI